MLGRRSRYSAALTAFAVFAAAPAFAQVGLSDRLDAAEARLNSDIAACKALTPEQIDEYRRLQSKADRNYRSAIEAVYAGVPIDRKTAVSDVERARDLLARALRQNERCTEKAPTTTAQQPAAQTPTPSGQAAEPSESVLDEIEADERFEAERHKTQAQTLQVDSEGWSGEERSGGTVGGQVTNWRSEFEWVIWDNSEEPKQYLNLDIPDGATLPLDDLFFPKLPERNGVEELESPTQSLKPFDQRLLDIQNGERTAMGLPPLQWDPKLAETAAAYAAELARTGTFTHASREGRGIERENINQAFHGSSPDQLMANWLGEKPHFRAGVFPNVSDSGNWYDVGHYSQIIWPETTAVGCGVARGVKWDFFVCRYSPGGNKDGKPVGLPPAQASVNDNYEMILEADPGGKVVGGEWIGGGRTPSTPPQQPRTTTEKASAATRYQWIDVKTGKPVFSPPYVPDAQGHYHVVLPEAGNPHRAYDPETGRNFVRENGKWIDVKTGKPVFSPPYVPDGQGHYHVVLPDAGDPNRAYDPETGRNFARQTPRPPK